MLCSRSGALAAAVLLTTGITSAATTTYTSVWSGGTIAPGDAVVLADGATVGGPIAIDGTLQFHQTTALTIATTVSGTGTLALTNTGTLSLTGLASGTGRYDLAINAASGGLNIGSTGTNPLIIGDTGAGSLAVTGGGIVRNGIGYLGFNAGSMGTATVSSGTWFNAAGSSGRILYVGFSGTGSLDVSGGTVTNSNGYVGFNAGSMGTVTVSSGTWQNRGPLYLGGGVGGTGGMGTLTVSGGQVTSTFGHLGANTTGVGGAVISGGTWSMTVNLNVGTSGTGTLTISGSGGTGGSVIVGGTVSRGASGAINLNSGGTLQIGTGTTTGGLATDLVNNGTLIFNRTGSGTVATAISGSGALVLAGSGTLTFAGTNSFTGPTAVDAGALSITGAFGTSAVSVNSGGRLLGSGTLGGPVTVTGGGILSPGVGIESLAVGAVDLFDGSAFVSELSSSAPLSAAADLLSIAGNLSLSGTVDLVLLDLAVTPAAFPNGTTLSLASYTGGWNGGLFRLGDSTLADGATFFAGSQQWLIDYDATLGGANFTGDQLAGGSFVNLVAVPEPSTMAMLAVGMASWGMLRERQQTTRSRR
ncbi:MAG: beta strand repeat-containing protein [Planctomycetia bacterium]